MSCMSHVRGEILEGVLLRQDVIREYSGNDLLQMFLRRKSQSIDIEGLNTSNEARKVEVRGKQVCEV